MRDLRTFPRRSLWAISLVAVSCFCSCQETTEPIPTVPQEQQARRSSPFPPPLDRPTEDPTVRLESSAERRESTREAFTDAELELGGQHALAISVFFQDLKRTINGGDDGKFFQLWNLEAMSRLLEQQKLISKPLLESETQLRTLRKRLGETLFTKQKVGIVFGAPLETVEIRHVHFIKMDSEAIVYVRLRRKDGFPSKMRWWLIKEKGQWLFYDFEALDTPIRQSTSLAITLSITDEKDPSVVAAFKQFYDTFYRAMNGEFDSIDEGLRAFEQVDGTKLPPVLEAMRLMLMAAILAEEKGEYRKALQLAERSALLNPDMPLRDLLFAGCELELGRYDEAHKHAEKYAAAVGRDSEYYFVVGAAHFAQGNLQKAMDAYKKGVADDPQDGDIVLGLLRVTPPQQRDVVVSHYKALKDVDQWFLEFADVLFEKKDTQSLRVLLDIHRLLYPNDKNLDAVEADLKSLSQPIPEQGTKKTQRHKTLTELLGDRQPPWLDRERGLGIQPILRPLETKSPSYRPGINRRRIVPWYYEPGTWPNRIAQAPTFLKVVALILLGRMFTHLSQLKPSSKGGKFVHGLWACLVFAALSFLILSWLGGRRTD